MEATDYVTAIERFVTQIVHAANMKYPPEEWP